MATVIACSCVTVTADELGCEVCFDNGDEHVDWDDREPYLLLQGDFEDSPPGLCYLETLDVGLCGHHRFSRAELSRTSLLLGWFGDRSQEFRVEFRASDEQFATLREALRRMVPRIKVLT